MNKLFFVFFFPFILFATVKPGINVLIEEKLSLLKGKKIGVLTNQTGLTKKLVSTIEILEKNAKDYSITALFCPEHGLFGACYAGENVKDGKYKGKIPIYSLHGEHRRPTTQMLKNIDAIVFDIQEIGVRAYTYTSTLFYLMEEAVKHKIQIIVLDRPNPINGNLVDGPMLDKSMRSFLGYVNVPYCHGMTIGELAHFFNKEYAIGCKLEVVKMKGWKRHMTYKDTGLFWTPTSPHIPESETPIYCASTGILGELGLVNIGVGYTQPFKIIGAPWINAEEFAKKLNEQKLPGVSFLPYYYRPFYGIYKNENCQGVQIIITDKTSYRPLAVQYLLIGLLKSHYPKRVNKHLQTISSSKKSLFCKANGNKEMLRMLIEENYIAWKMIEYEKEERKAFLEKRKKYLFY